MTKLTQLFDQINPVRTIDLDEARRWVRAGFGHVKPIRSVDNSGFEVPVRKLSKREIRLNSDVIFRAFMEKVDWIDSTDDLYTIRLALYSMPMDYQDRKRIENNIIQQLPVQFLIYAASIMSEHRGHWFINWPLGRVLITTVSQATSTGETITDNLLQMRPFFWHELERDLDNYYSDMTNATGAAGAILTLEYELGKFEDVVANTDDHEIREVARALIPKISERSEQVRREFILEQ